MAIAAKIPAVIERIAPFKKDLGKVVFVLQGNDYERHIFEQFKEQLGNDFVELENASMAQTIALLRAGIPVVAQGFLEAPIGDHLWSGYPDLLIREDFTYENGQVFQFKQPSEKPKYVVWDVKASKDPDPKYWLQVASYSKVLEGLNLASPDDLGIIAKYYLAVRNSRQESLTVLDLATETLLTRLALSTPNTIDESFIEEWHCQTVSSCSKNSCELPKHCEHSLKEEHSLQILYGRNPVEKMRKAGIQTYDDLLENDDPQWQKQRDWARVLNQEVISQEPYFELLPRDQWILLPTPTPDDLFFDIEWFNPTLEDEALVFEFGFVDGNEQFTSLDGFSHDDELPNFEEFVEIAKLKMNSNPLARIYHYSNPEETYLNKLVTKYGVLHTEVEFLISRMVDLSKNAKSMILPGSNGYSIKELERYYDADTKLNRKANGVSGGADAMYLFYQATVSEPEKAEQHMNTIRAYNKDDCLSTKLLRDWLLSL
jgi:uncharacterized protein